MLEEVLSSKTIASFRGLGRGEAEAPYSSTTERNAIIARAEAMCHDENRFFTFPYTLHGIDRPWNYDPIEKKYWPERHYTESELHAADTPNDVKIVWEINRFKDLPTLAQAAALTKEIKYRDEIEHRILSWIADNPFANSINWASSLEIAIRLVSWTTVVELLQRAGMRMDARDAIGRSVWQQAKYLAQDLSLDKIVRSNHLIGEAAGLFVTSHAWEYPEANEHREIARRILEKEIADQTYADGSTKESSTWYHQFVANFFQIVERVAIGSGQPMSELFLDRLSRMESFLEAMRPNAHSKDANNIVRIGDADDGWAIFFEGGEQQKWLDSVFGTSSRVYTPTSLFPIGGYAALRAGDSYSAMRAGPFGMGGDGFSSHAHDDCLSPILYLQNIPVLVDPGTYVYNGAQAKRKEYRAVEAHNSVEIDSLDRAEQKLNFGWKTIRPDASLLEAGSDDRESWCSAIFGESRKWHKRTIRLEASRFVIMDTVDFEPRKEPVSVKWHFHLAPRWKLVTTQSDNMRFQSGDEELQVRVTGKISSLSTAQYSFSPSYLREEMATVILAESLLHTGEIIFSFELLSGRE